MIWPRDGAVARPECVSFFLPFVEFIDLEFLLVNVSAPLTIVQKKHGANTKFKFVHSYQKQVSSILIVETIPCASIFV